MDLLRIIRSAVLLLFIFVLLSSSIEAFKFTPNRMRYYRDKVKSMFYHAYEGYLKYAFPLDELKPLSCEGMDTWGSFSLTLIDALDTLLIMGNHSEFIRASNIILNSVKIDANVNVSVFETNIRVVGGLLSAHLLSGRVDGIQLEPGWPCSGPLLRLAERFAQKLLPAFNTYTGMPFGTVNLRYGVHYYETPITCTAGVGTMLLEFGSLSRITGNPIYERVALKALDALWKSRSRLGLVGNHINVQTGVWTATDAGIGAGVDSYFEYLAKGALLFQRPRLMHQFNQYVKSMNKHMRKDDWFMWVSMTKGQVSLPIFQSLEAFWPGILALTGNLEDAQRVIYQYSQIIKQYGFPPEFYNIPSQEAVHKRSGYPLRPEFIESLYYIYRGTRDPALLHLAASMVEAIQHSCRTSCGFATVENVNDHTVEDRMESFFLAETTKYLYLLFDEDNFINNDGTTSRVVETLNGACILDAGGYIFNTEAHPIDPAAIYCCSAKRSKDIEILRRFEDSIKFSDLFDLTDPFVKQNRFFDKTDLASETIDLLKDEEMDDSEDYDDSMWSEDEDTIEAEVEHTSSGSEAEMESDSGGDPRTRTDHVRTETQNVQKVVTVNSAESSSVEFFQMTDSHEDTRNDSSQTEKIRHLLEQARKYDERIEMKERRKSNLAKKLLDALKTMDSDIKSVLSASKHFKNIENLEKQKRIGEMFIPIVECQNCCAVVDQRFDSFAFKRFIALIHSNYLYPQHNIPTIDGPICRIDEEPSIEDEYSNEWPDVSDIDTSQVFDAVDEIHFGSIRYRSLTAQHYELLSSEPLSFWSLFTGLGQVLPANVQQPH